MIPGHIQHLPNTSNMRLNWSRYCVHLWRLSMEAVMNNNELFCSVVIMLICFELVWKGTKSALSSNKLHVCIMNKASLKQIVIAMVVFFLFLWCSVGQIHALYLCWRESLVLVKSIRPHVRIAVSHSTNIKLGRKVFLCFLLISSGRRQQRQLLVSGLGRSFHRSLYICPFAWKRKKLTCTSVIFSGVSLFFFVLMLPQLLLLFCCYSSLSPLCFPPARLRSP